VVEAAAVIANPFVPPGSESAPDAPLRADDHDAWYIESVAGHEECFRDFCEALDQSARKQVLLRRQPVDDIEAVRKYTVPALRGAGRLVVVEGPERSGKSTFINRCVRELQRRCDGTVRLKPVYVNGISLSSDDRQLLTAHQLRVRVCKHVLEEVPELQNDVLTRAAANLDPGPDGSGGSPDVAYRIIRNHLNINVVLLVLLPPAPADTDVANLDVYHDWMGPGMIFFAERTTTPSSPPLPRRAAPPEAESTLVLSLRNLAPGEAYRVVRTRLGPDPQALDLPDVEEETLTEVEGLNRSDQNTIGWVVALFRELCQRRIDELSSPKYLRLPSISYEEITDLLARRVNGEQP
jgi:hypothetical protein